MGFSLDDYADLRPCLYHLVAKGNLTALRATRTLLSTKELAGRSGRPDLLARRRILWGIETADGAILVRDQKPLSMGNVLFEGGWGEEDLLDSLAGRVFFWPGTVDGPIAHGRRAAAVYQDTDMLLRLPFRAVAGEGPEFCKYNSGSPRSVGGRKSPRGPRTFLPAELCDYRPSKVVEVTFKNALRLPDRTVMQTVGGVHWEPLFDA